MSEVPRLLLSQAPRLPEVVLLPEVMRLPEVLHLLVGPRQHGVVQFGRRLGELMGARVEHLAPAEQTAGEDQFTITQDQVDDALESGPGAALPPAVHLQYTDALYARHTTRAAEAFVRLRHQIAAPVGVTLHDLPDPGDEPARYLRRAHSYARVARAVDVVAVSSRHELMLLERLLAAAPGEPREGSAVTDVVIAEGGSGTAQPAGAYPAPAPAPAPARVIPLPLEIAQLTAPGRRPRPDQEVAVFGFVYPGKGHNDVLEAMSGLPASVTFTALGRTADGHDRLGTVLAAIAGQARRGFRITGFVPQEELVHLMQRVAVPVVPGRMISASASINSWIAAGRRPLVATGAYTREFDERYPGAIELYRPQQLPALIRAVLADPDRSWLRAAVPPELTGPAIARSYTDLLLGARRGHPTGLRA